MGVVEWEVIILPPKQKFTKEEIINTAFNLVRRDGITALTARGLGVELGTSSRPIFTAFRNMEEVQQETMQAARALYNRYVEKGFKEEIAFRGVGMQYLRFAKEESHLFELLFMTSGETAFHLNEILPVIDDNSDKILNSIQEPYGLSREDSYKLYQALWIFTHGIACLYVTGVSRLSEEEASELLTEVFTGLIIKMKNEGKQNG